MNNLILSKDSKVFVFCVAGVVTGGAELLHQLVDVINRNHGDAYIVYVGRREKRIPEAYSQYQIKVADSIEDEENNIIVIFEGYYEAAFTFRKAQIVLWWLSVDHYFIYNRHTFPELLRYQMTYPQKFETREFLSMCKNALLHPKNRISLRKLRKLNVACNAYQSEYAYNFLKQNGFNNLYPLKDYINSDNFEGVYPERREDIVIYNPKKGYEFTKRLMQAAPDINWIPIQNMTRLQVIDLMRKAKVYIDFGYHPGKDRLPREAAANGCCVITGKLGSAAYKDVDIPERYKHLQTSKNIDEIISQIRYLFDNYNEVSLEFNQYRESIRKEKAEFERDAIMLFINDKDILVTIG